MDYNFSELVDPSSYDRDDLCVDIPLRRHADALSETIGSFRAQRDWSALVKPVKNYQGGLGPYTFMRVTVPECLPERLEVISYANEFAFLYDDIMEDLDFEDHIKEKAEVLDVFLHEPLEKQTEDNAQNRGEKQIQSGILNEMVAIDPQRGVTSMKAWATFIELAASRERTVPFNTLEEYLPYRIIDAGERIWFGTLTFAMALTIPDSELDLCKTLTNSAYAVLALVNDLYSWPKEREAATKAGMEHVVNAIWVIMHEQTCSEADAKAQCREKVGYYTADYLKVVAETKESPGISKDLRTYVEALQYSMSGNLVWSLYCPRYHSKKEMPSNGRKRKRSCE